LAKLPTFHKKANGWNFFIVRLYCFPRFWQWWVLYGVCFGYHYRRYSW